MESAKRATKRKITRLCRSVRAGKLLSKMFAVTDSKLAASLRSKKTTSSQLI